MRTPGPWTPDYPALVAAAKAEFASEIEVRSLHFRARRARRNAMGEPALCIVGQGEAGKDEVAKILVHRCGLVYEGGTSRIFAPMIAYGLKIPMEEAYSARRENREYWFQWMTEFRRGDPAGVARLQMAYSDLCVGIRGEEELRTAVGSDVVTLPVWVDREGCNTGAHEVTLELVWQLDGEVIENNDSLSDLEDRVVDLAKSVDLPVNDNRMYEVNRG